MEYHGVWKMQHVSACFTLMHYKACFIENKQILQMYKYTARNHAND